MKILLVINSLGMGGAENAVVNLADELYTRGHSVKIVYLTNEILVYPKNSEIELLPLDMKNKKHMPIAYFKLKKIVGEYKPDVIHSHLFRANLLVRLLRLSTKVNVIITSEHSKSTGGVKQSILYRLTDVFSNITTNVSEEAVESYIKKGAVRANQIVSIPNGINTNIFKFSNTSRSNIREKLGIENKSLLLSVGRLSPAKDYPNLLKAVKILIKTNTNFKLIIVGEGPERELLEKMILNLKITDFVELIGLQKNIPELMSACDAFVLSSAWEGFGLVVAEAMACERVVIATDCGGVKEVIGPHGFIVPIKDSPSLAGALKKALELNVEEKIKIGKEARNYINDKYTLDKNVESYLKLYKKSLYTTKNKKAD